MRSTSYAAKHAAKSAINEKHIDINDLEEGVKLAILADTERDQRLLMCKESIEKSFAEAKAQKIALEKKREADHSSFDSFVKKAREEKNELGEKYGLKCLEYLKLQKSYDELSDKYYDAMGQLDTAALLNKNLETLNDMKHMEIQDLRTALAFQSLPDPDINSLVHIMSKPDTN